MGRVEVVELISAIPVHSGAPGIYTGQYRDRSRLSSPIELATWSLLWS